MIKKIKKARSKKIPFILSAIVVIALIGGGVYWYNQTKSTHNQQLTQKQKSEAQTPNPKDSSPNKVSSGSNGNGSVPIPPTPAPTNPSASLSISSFSEVNNVVQAIATITNATSGGSCYFAFSSPGSKPVVQSVTSNASGSTQNCTFSSSNAAFDKIGTWQLQVTYTAGGTQVEGSQNVTIQ